MNPAELDDAVNIACTFVQHPVRRWVLCHAATHGEVSTNDICREFPYLATSHGNASIVLRPIVQSGVLVVTKRSHRGNTYRLGNLSVLHSLHATLAFILSPTPEVPRETHD